MTKRTNKTQIKVLKNFNGLTHGFEIVETILRTPIRRTSTVPGQKGYYTPYYLVNYKGRKYEIFTLGMVYGEAAGQCIKID